MERECYVDHIERVLNNSFEITHNKKIIDRDIDIYGKWSMEFGRNFISKNMIIDKFECNEHCMIKNVDMVTQEYLLDFEKFLEDCTLKIVNPHRDHKTTYITGIIITNDVEEEIPKLVKKYRYTKNYMFSIRGWSIVRLIVVDLINEKIYSNKASKELVESLSFSKVMAS